MNKAPMILMMMEAIMPGSLERILNSKCSSCGADIDPDTDFTNDLSGVSSTSAVSAKNVRMTSGNKTSFRRVMYLYSAVV